MTGAAWLSSARAVRCTVKSDNERNPCRMLYFSCETALVNKEEGRDDVKSAWLLRPGLHTRYNGWYKGHCEAVTRSESQKATLSSD
jgi:hypothetical protein